MGNATAHTVLETLPDGGDGTVEKGLCQGTSEENSGERYCTMLPLTQLQEQMALLIKQAPNIGHER